MSEEKAAVNTENYEIGFYNNGEVMVVTIPLRKWSQDKDYGDIKISGTFIKAERIALKNVQLMRAEDSSKGLVKPVVMPGKANGLNLA